MQQEEKRTDFHSDILVIAAETARVELTLSDFPEREREKKRSFLYFGGQEDMSALVRSLSFFPSFPGNETYATGDRPRSHEFHVLSALSHFLSISLFLSGLFMKQERE